MSLTSFDYYYMMRASHMHTLNKFHQISYGMLSNRYTLSIVGLKIARYLLIN